MGSLSEKSRLSDMGKRILSDIFWSWFSTLAGLLTWKLSKSQCPVCVHRNFGSVAIDKVQASVVFESCPYEFYIQPGLSTTVPTVIDRKSGVVGKT